MSDPIKNFYITMDRAQSAPDYEAMVPVDELHCPTCGERMDPDTYGPLPEPVFTDSIKPVDFVQPEPPSIACVDGHRWTIKAIGHSVEQGERVLLGEYLLGA